MADKRRIEVFTAGCPLCNETLALIKKAVAACGCEVIERRCSEKEVRVESSALHPQSAIAWIQSRRNPTDHEPARPRQGNLSLCHRDSRGDTC